MKQGVTTLEAESTAVQDHRVHGIIIPFVKKDGGVNGYKKGIWQPKPPYFLNLMPLAMIGSVYITWEHPYIQYRL
jgi:hypothetical protein